MELDEASDAEPLPWERARRRATKRVPHLVLAWSLYEHDRLGEVVPVHGPGVVGRGGPAAEDPAPRISMWQLRPRTMVEGAPIANARIARRQLVVEPRGEDGVYVRSLGPARLRVAGREVVEGEARAGEVIEIHNAAVFVVTSRPERMTGPADEATPLSDFAYGGPDDFGIVGESERAWKLREAIAFAASTSRHVLLLGESGVGKELAARAVHGMSSRRDRVLVARNAATMPESLIDAELFGNVRDYPNPGMAERAGLIGEADGSTLFLDEIGDLPERCQVHLLRVLDADGEYQRLGAAQTKRSAFRLVAATNRAPEMLKPDFLARFTHRIVVPGLGDRQEDVPLMLAEVLRRTARDNPAIAARFFERRNGAVAEPRLAPDLVVRLLGHSFTHHVRELERLAWLAIGTAEADYIGLTPEVEAELAASAGSAAEIDDIVDAGTLDRDTIAQALADHGRSPTRTAKALGLKNRFVLLRLLKKHGLSVSDD